MHINNFCLIYRSIIIVYFVRFYFFLASRVANVGLMAGQIFFFLQVCNFCVIYFPVLEVMYIHLRHIFHVQIFSRFWTRLGNLRGLNFTIL